MFNIIYTVFDDWSNYRENGPVHRSVLSVKRKVLSYVYYKSVKIVSCSTDLYKKLYQQNMYGK